MEINRRKILLGMIIAGLSPKLSAVNLPVIPKQFLISAKGKQGSQFGLGWVNSRHPAVHGEALAGFRGHGLVQNPRNPSAVLMFARRPGSQGVELDLETGILKSVFRCSQGRHLLGHGCFNASGDVLFSTELDFKSGKGKIVVRDALTYRQLDEYESHGVGPHEVKLMPDGATLVVANGGIKTHPDTGRKKLNLESMDSALSYIDSRNGELLDEVRVPESKASIRHLDISEDGVVAFGLQMQRKAARHNQVVALSAIHKKGEAIKLFEKPVSIVHSMNDYAGSVTINNLSRVAGFTSPKGNVAAFWHIDSQRFVGYHSLHDVCGLAVSKDQAHFIVSNSTGELRFLDAVSIVEDKAKRVKFPDMSWDNHLLAASF